MSIELSPDMSGFFQERLAAALARRRVDTDVATEAYLVRLLASFADAPVDPALDQPLVARLAEALEAPSDHERLRLFRALGDNALYVCGFFSDRLERRGVSRGYVVSMGERAYVSAAYLSGRAHLRSIFAEVYDELADRFDLFAQVLDEVRESTSLRTPQDIVRLYERWRRTGSPLLAKRLQSEGVFPQPASRKTTLH